MLVNNAEARELLAMCIKALRGNKELTTGSSQLAEDRGPAEHRGHSRSTEWAH